MEQSKLYTDYADIYDLFYQKHFNYPKIAKLIDSHLKKHKAKKILHVGSGPGRLSKILSEKYKYEVHLLDSSSEMIDLSHRLLPELPHTLADMRDFHLREDFDAVVLAGRAFAHLLRDEDIEEALEKFHDSLKVRGILIFDNFYADKLVDGEIFNEKKQVKSKGFDVIRRVKTKMVSYEPAVANLEMSYQVMGEGRVEFHEVEHMFRAFSQDEITKLSEQNDFEVLEFAPGFDKVSYYTIAKVA
jgi:SAM-dependent methyltransferase